MWLHFVDSCVLGGVKKCIYHRLWPKSLKAYYAVHIRCVFYLTNVDSVARIGSLGAQFAIESIDKRSPL